MANITLSVPDDLGRKIKHLKWANWSEIARQAIEKRLSDFETVEKIASKSKLTKMDAREIADKIDRSAVKRLGVR